MANTCITAEVNQKVTSPCMFQAWWEIFHIYNWLCSTRSTIAPMTENFMSSDLNVWLLPWQDSLHWLHSSLGRALLTSCLHMLIADIPSKNQITRNTLLLSKFRSQVPVHTASIINLRSIVSRLLFTKFLFTLCIEFFSRSEGGFKIILSALAMVHSFYTEWK